MKTAGNNIMDCADLSIGDLAKVACQTGGKIVNDPISGVPIIIWGQRFT